jgi:hypothetical protein
MYEKSMGVFCPGCEPTDPEEIRAFRLAKAERKASRYDGWADKRETEAHRALNSHPELRHDWAFITQPGHIPARARMNAADQRAIESLNKAREMRSRAAGIRHVQVAGDAERKRQAKRDALDKVITKGSAVVDAIFGAGIVRGVYKKSYRIEFSSGFTCARDKSFVRPTEVEKCTRQ